jgi:agmatine deiminase
VLTVRRDNGSIYLAIRALVRPWMFIALLMPIAVLLLSACQPATAPHAQRRVPAEWEPHAATWMQWPGEWETDLRPSFATIIAIVQRYEPVHLLTSTRAEQLEARQFLADSGVPETAITWHIVPVDNAWMRDNGPIYVTDGTRTWIQNWRFDAWGGNWGSDIGYEDDNRVPIRVADYLDIAVEDYQHYVLEKGNLESNGAGILVLNWDCQDHRNPGMTQAEHEAILTEAFGATQIIWAYGYDPDDGTTGHIDGTARFIDAETLVVADYDGTETEQELAVAAAAAGLNVIRYPGDPNWLVGNGFVLARAEGDPAVDDELQAQLDAFFPGRTVYLIDIEAIAHGGGGIHCVTNDQPVLARNPEE